MNRCLSVGNVSDCTDPSDPTDLIDPCSSVVITKKFRKQRKNNSLHTYPLHNSSQSIMDSVINTVARSSDSITYRGASDGVSDVNKQISEKKQTINNQNIIINNVVNRLNFLLSKSSIDEVSMPVLSAAECSSVEVNINSYKVTMAIFRVGKRKYFHCLLDSYIARRTLFIN